MKQIMRVAAMAIAAIGAVKATQAEEAETQASSPYRYFSLSALALGRDLSDTGAIIAANPAGTPFLTGEDFDFGLSAGVDASVGFTAFGNDVIEARLTQGSASFRATPSSANSRAHGSGKPATRQSLV